MSIYKYLKKEKGRYIVTKAIYYHSLRYDKSIEINENFSSDGATGYWDINSLFWVIHDFLKLKRQWSDGSHCTNWQASVVAFDILWQENRVIHAPIVFLGTLVWGYLMQIFKGLK